MDDNNLNKSQLDRIIQAATGGFVAENLGLSARELIEEELNGRAPAGPTLFSRRDGTETTKLIRALAGGHYVCIEDSEFTKPYLKYLSPENAFIWTLRHGFVHSIEQFCEANARAMFRRKISPTNYAKLDSYGSYECRVRELLELDVFRKCAINIEDKTMIIDMNADDMQYIEQWCHDCGAPFSREDEADFTTYPLDPLLNTIGGDVDKILVGSLATKNGYYEFVTSYALSWPELPEVITCDKFGHGTWCIPIDCIPCDDDLRTVCIAAITLCVVAEAEAFRMVEPEVILDITEINYTSKLGSEGWFA